VSAFFFVAGDPSGDERAAEVARALKARAPESRIIALGGSSLRSVADRFLYDLVGESVMGFWEPLKKVPRFLRILNAVVRPALREEPAVVVPTDFYGFNRHVAAAAKAAGRRVVYYVSPQVWASRPGRIDVLKKVVDRMLVIFPFEEALYRARGVPVTFVGHPLVDALPAVDPEAPLKVDSTVGLLPGSRPGEVRRPLPGMQSPRPKPLGFQCLDLISHQCDQRGNDNHQTLFCIGRLLIAKGLSSPCGEHGHHVMARKNMVNDFFLAKAKTINSRKNQRKPRSKLAQMPLKDRHSNLPTVSGAKSQKNIS
jgi:hypothetical protein